MNTANVGAARRAWTQETMGAARRRRGLVGAAMAMAALVSGAACAGGGGAASSSTPAAAATPAAATAPPPPQIAALNSGPGAMVVIEEGLPPGYVTIVDFWAEYCAACKVIDAELQAKLPSLPAVVLRKVDVGPGDSEVAKAYKLGGLPHLRIFDRRGRLRYVLVGNDAHQAADAAAALSAEK
jgi:thiol-disulfide isomerase/thioredoxin